MYAMSRHTAVLWTEHRRQEDRDRTRKHPRIRRPASNKSAASRRL